MHDCLGFYEVTVDAIPDLAHLDAGPRFRGGIDWFKDATLSGWAIDLTQPRSGIAITIVAEGIILAESETSIGRLDLEPFVRNNFAGFRIDFRLMDESDQQQVVELLTVADPMLPCDLVVRLGDGASRIELGRYGVTKGDVLAQILTALAEQPPSAPEPRETARRPGVKLVKPNYRNPDAAGLSSANWPPLPAMNAPARSHDPSKMISSGCAHVAAQQEPRAAWLAAAVADERRNTIAVLRCLCGGAEGFEPYAASVGNEPRRLFSFALGQAIRSISFVSNHIRSHATTIVDLFDPGFYLGNYPNATLECENPLLHYVLIGWRDGLRPNPLFDVEYYRAQMGNAKEDPLLHYVVQGAAAGLNPHPLFDTKFYRTTYLLGEDSGINPLSHYQVFGGIARFEPSPLFDTHRFLDALPIAAYIACPLEVFVTKRELHDHDVLEIFDAKLYRYQLEVERGEVLGEPPLVHYLRSGFRDETLLPNLFFDPHFYRERNTLNLEGPALLHYMDEGDRLGLACHPLFSVKFYNEQRGADHDGTTALAHFFRHPEMGFKTDHRMQQPPDRALLRFVRRVAEFGDVFDPFFYRDANKDLSGHDILSLRSHYETHGRKEGRVGSEATLLTKADVKIRDISLGFFADEYVYLNPDLGHLRGNFTGSLCHYLLHGRLETERMIGKWQFHYDDINLTVPTTASPLRVVPTPPHVELCILIHVFYPDIWKELAGFAQNFRNRSYDIFINLVDESWSPDLHCEIRDLCPGAFLQLSNDSGRDIGGFVRLLDNIQIDRYDVFAFMHTKKSPHIAIERGEHWRRTLLRAIAGSVEIADECIATFLEDKSVGMIGAKEWQSFELGKGFDQYEKLLDLLEVTGKNREIDYLSGFMCLARSDVIKRLHGVLRDVEWEYGGDKGLDFHMDGQIAHGVERALPALVRQMGYQVLYR